MGSERILLQKNHRNVKRVERGTDQNGLLFHPEFIEIGISNEKQYSAIGGFVEKGKNHTQEKLSREYTCRK